MTDIARMYMSH